MAISFELWVNNLIAAAAGLADEKTQRRWLAPDAAPWERPAELLNVLLDDSCLELFINDEGSKLSPVQFEAATNLAQAALRYDCGPDGWKDPNEIFHDPEWQELRRKAERFIGAFSASHD